MAETRGMSASAGVVTWEMTVPEATHLANHLDRLAEIEPERNMGGHLTHIAGDLQRKANEAAQRRAFRGVAS